MNKCDSCSSKNNCKSNGNCSKLACKYGNIKNIIGVISGKGGVGKSTVTGILAVKLAQKGFKVGILDGDITGPSMPRILGINDKRSLIVQNKGSEDVKFVPVETPKGIKVISLNLMIESEDQPVIWRGPVINSVLNQMYADTEWGDLDYLIIDMPPGTGDVALTVMQNISLSGMIIVSTPQDMVSMIVKKVVTMAKKMNVNILGVVENMSYIVCEKCGEKMRVFSKKSAKEQAEYLGLPLVCEMPIDLDLVDNLEKGTVEEYIYDNDKYENILDNIL
ncbi:MULTISPECIES: Mrp/NBP35 family ATP-binding protein [Clostridium]|uniref:Mrp/NBP35 family ATP-binding protein n=1 Tax=Clostridium TaxID=1485 RepID=UPI0008264D0E|nr:MULTISPECIES: Mrp/NBP35 family ATP-binding protein [Clostridium]PJI09024.1 ATP-binding protein [Clostridium sp. CT7]